jgi:hypothetical protein
MDLALARRARGDQPVTNTSAPTVTDETCRALDRVTQPLDAGVVHRFLVGEDRGPRPMSREEAERELGDPFATLLLLRGTFPRTGAEVLAAVDRATGQNDPLRKQMSFVLGEASQLGTVPQSQSTNRELRFLLTRGSGTEGPDLMLSAAGPNAGLVEVMAWDRRSNGFNYYRTVGQNPAWVWAGNSRHALRPPTEGKGPFESHTSGNFLMKELRAPWLHWHSPDANILPTALEEGDPIRDHPWFTRKEPQGALVCELSVARPSITRWTKARLEAAIGDDGSFDGARGVMAQVLGTPTVNLITSHTESRKAVTSPTVDLPQTFFVDSEALTEILGLQAPPRFMVPGAVYARALETFAVRLTDDKRFSRPGDTHFAFAVPERALEDQEVLRAAIRVGLVSERLAACLLMTDFPNPIFSPRREALLRHVPERALVDNGQSAESFSQAMADAILAAADASPAGTPEREFAQHWGVGENFKVEFDRLLSGYYQAVVRRLQDPAGFDDYFRLAESRRERVRAMPIFESPLLLARTNIPRAARAMRADGTVATLTGA